MMGTEIVVGAGAVGTATAVELVAQGREVTMVTRSGSGPERAGISRVAADAADATVMAGSPPEPMPSTTGQSAVPTAGRRRVARSPASLLFGRHHLGGRRWSP